jgi:hypothetical protein
MKGFDMNDKSYNKKHIDQSALRLSKKNLDKFDYMVNGGSGHKGAGE